MDRDALHLLLAQGCSLAEIGRRFGRHESTVGYWAQKHGLEAVKRHKHVAKGGLSREELERLVEAGKSIGARTIFVGDAKRRKRFAKELASSPPDAIAKDLREAASVILGQS